MKAPKLISKRKLIPVVTAALLFSACAEAPKEVKEEKETLDNFSQPEIPNSDSQSAENNESAENNGLEYASLDDIRKDADELMKNNDSNVKFSTVRVGSGKTMPTYKIDPYNQNYDQLDDIIDHFYHTDFSLDSPRCEHYTKGMDLIESPDQPYTNTTDCILFYPEDMDSSKSLVYHETGYSFYSSTEADDPYRYIEDLPTEKRYKIFLGDQLDDSTYKMSDGSEWSVKDAAEYAQDFCDTYFKPLEKELFDYRLTDFRVKKLGDDFGYSLYFQRVDKDGNLFDDHRAYPIEQPGFDPRLLEWIWGYLENSNPYLYDSEINITFKGKESMSAYYKGLAPYHGDEPIDSGEKLLTLSSAIDVISSQMAGGTTYTFETAELEYYYVALDCPHFTDPVGDNKRSWGDLDMLNSADIQLRPYWAFTKSKTFTDVQDSSVDTINTPNSLYLVDALTGKLSIY